MVVAAPSPSGLGQNSRMALRIVDSLYGLVSTDTAPAALNSAAVTSITSAVNPKITGGGGGATTVLLRPFGLVSIGELRMLRVASIPSTTGMWKSMSTQSNGRPFAAADSTAATATAPSPSYTLSHF